MAKSNQNSNSEVEAPPIPPVKAKAPIKEELYDYLPKRIIQVRAVPATEEQPTYSTQETHIKYKRDL